MTKEECEIETSKAIMEMRSRIAELEKENAELKKELKISQRCWQDQKNISLNANCSLHKAKEIIKDYMTIAKGNHTTVCGVSEENRTINVLQLNEEAEQFLREVEE